MSEGDLPKESTLKEKLETYTSVFAIAAVVWKTHFRPER
jgi:hypothetical protein